MEVEEAGEVFTNYLARENGAKLTAVTSERQNCAGANVLEGNSRVSATQQTWVSKEGMPQSLVFDISRLSARAKDFQCFGWQCWHPYSSNPAVVELWLAEESGEFVKWARFVGELKAGNQFFRIDPIPRKYRLMKVVVVETHGASNTYLNRVFLLESLPREKTVDRSRTYSVISHVEDLPKAAKVDDPKTRLNSLLFELQEDLKSMQLERMLTPIRFTETTFNCKTPVEDLSEVRDSKVRDISSAVASLALQVRNLQQTVTARSSGELLRQLRTEMQSEPRLQSQQLSPRLRVSGEELWEQDMHLWTERVLEPRLAALERKVMSRLSSTGRIPKPDKMPAPQSILEELNEKLNLKAQKLAELERERTRRLRSLTRPSGSVTPLDSSAEHVRYRDLA